MKPIFTSLCLCLMISTFTAEAQRQSIDTDILALRNAAVPSFNWHYDDYLQYGPAGVMLGLKAFGYEGRSSWGGCLYPTPSQPLPWQLQ